MNKINMNTNTAYLLNTWFNDKHCLWKDVKKFIKQKHEEAWNVSGDFNVKVTFEVVNKSKPSAKTKNE